MRLFFVSAFALTLKLSSLDHSELRAEIREVFGDMTVEDIIREMEEMPTVYENMAGDGAKVWVKLASSEYPIFHIHGTGFKPYESSHFASLSYDEAIYDKMNADENGNLPLTIFTPTVIGKPEGICHVHIFRANGPLHLTIPWRK
jgi:hypothetical protein